VGEDKVDEMSVTLKSRIIGFANEGVEEVDTTPDK